MKRGLLVALCLLLAAGFAALGGWQVERRAWKLELIARIEAREHAPPRTVSSLADLKGDIAYSRVRAPGTLLHDRETLVQAVTELGGGYWVLTPFRTASGTILVNRGFVRAGQRDSRDRAFRGAAERTYVSGLLRDTEPRGAFLRRNAPAANRWYSRDVAAIARARGIGPVPPFFIDEGFRSDEVGQPVGGLTVVRFPNNHLLYAITWFALAALSLFGAWRLLKERR